MHTVCFIQCCWSSVLRCRIESPSSCAKVEKVWSRVHLLHRAAKSANSKKKTAVVCCMSVNERQAEKNLKVQVFSRTELNRNEVTTHHGKRHTFCCKLSRVEYHSICSSVSQMQTNQRCKRLCTPMKSNLSIEALAFCFFEQQNNNKTNICGKKACLNTYIHW